MEENISNFVNGALSQMPWIHNSVTSVVAIALIIITRTALVHVIKRKAEILDKDQRRWINRINNITTALIVLALALIWAPQLHTFALSLTAVAVAVVLITKELLMCLIGGFLRASSKPFEVGDWITIDDITGEVMQITATMTILEKVDVKHGHYDLTGETVQIPNSRFLTANVENLNFTKKYIYHSFNIVVQSTDLNPSDLKANLAAVTEKALEPFMKEANAFNKKIERKTGVDFAETKASIGLKTTDLGHFKFAVRIFAPTIATSKIEDDITTAFLVHCYTQRETIKKQAEEEKTAVELTENA
jgi:small-conductance mechanosensitive channel